MKTTNLLSVMLLIIAVSILSCKKDNEKVIEDNQVKTECIDSSKIKPNAITTPNWAPVCGCDGKTYSNSMAAKNNGVTNYTEGECEQSNCIDTSFMNTYVTHDINPVCGCNGVTYQNASWARSEGVVSYTKGKCEQSNCIDSSKIKPNAITTPNWAPVCGCDGKTYSNSMAAENNGVTNYTEGECGQSNCIDTSFMNTYVTHDINPVCGCNGVTYQNASWARSEGVVSYTKGKCEQSNCIDSSKIKPNAIITPNWAPVCGCDGKTYSNSMAAEVNGVTKYTFGECE